MSDLFMWNIFKFSKMSFFGCRCSNISLNTLIRKTSTIKVNYVNNANCQITTCI